MKIIKFKKREKFKYKRKVIIKDFTLNIFVGIHSFEKKKKQRVKFNIEILTDPYVSPNSKDLNSILNSNDKSQLLEQKVCVFVEFATKIVSKSPNFLARASGARQTRSIHIC